MRDSWSSPPPPLPHMAPRPARGWGFTGLLPPVSTNANGHHRLRAPRGNEGRGALAAFPFPRQVNEAPPSRALRRESSEGKKGWGTQPMARGGRWSPPHLAPAPSSSSSSQRGSHLSSRVPLPPTFWSAPNDARPLARQANRWAATPPRPANLEAVPIDSPIASFQRL